MPRVLVNVTSNDWAAHFIGPDGKTRIGPWLLLDGPEEVHAILRWGNASDEDLSEHAQVSTELNFCGAEEIRSRP
jgi:hypothetical protein